MFLRHESTSLTAQFKKKPYQGVSPDIAKFLFVGLDANYAQDIETKPIFTQILKYHEDGVMFWKQNGIHHPFLLATYNGSGQLYHKNFSKIGFTPNHAELVSFVELLHIPTTGRSSLSVDDLDFSHLSKISEWIMEGNSKYVFLSAGVIQLMKHTKVFPWLPSKIKPFDGKLTVLKRFSDKTIYKYLHFSNYGKFAKQMNEEAKEISLLINTSN